MPTQLSAPYRFVPLSRLVLLPDWARQVSHDTPFADGLCGELTLRLTAETQLCVGGSQDKATATAPGRVHFFRTPDRQPAIPGSSIKGMLRNVLEIASYGRFRQVEDQRLGVRDLSTANNFYCRAIVREPVRAGWLGFVDGQWQITPCAFSRLHQEELIKTIGIPQDNWVRLKTAPQRYAAIGVCPEVRFDRVEPMPNNDKQWLAQPKPEGPLHGRVVVTGQPGRDYTEPGAKKYEFIFHDAETAALTVSPEVMSGFRQIHEESKEWAFWRDKQSRGELDRGIPVFFHDKNGSVQTLGLAMMYKLPFAHSLHDAIRHTGAAHLDGGAPDLAELLFGYLEDGDRETGLRGRVSVGMATPLPRADGQQHAAEFGRPCILNGPKPTFYPAYIRQAGNTPRTLMDKDSELAGWKRYPVKREHLPALSGDAAKNPKVQVRLETLPRGTSFSTRLRFHNLRRVELGALLWALDFGGRSELRHAIGMGKPFGFGQLSITIESSKLRPNNPNGYDVNPAGNYLHACRQEFVDLMNQTLTAAGEEAPQPWDTSGPIKALLDYARPTHDDASLEYLPEPREFVPFRRPDRLSEVKTVFHDSMGVTPAKGYDTKAVRGYESHFASNLEQAAASIEAKRKKLELAEQKANATPEETLLLDIRMWSEAYLAGTGSKTLKDNLRKGLIEGHRIWSDLTPSQQLALREHAQALQGADDKALMKAVKKVLNECTP